MPPGYPGSCLGRLHIERWPLQFMCLHQTSIPRTRNGRMWAGWLSSTSLHNAEALPIQPELVHRLTTDGAQFKSLLLLSWQAQVFQALVKCRHHL